MIYDNVGGIRDFLKKDLALEFCRKKTKSKDISTLTETHINHDQTYHLIHIRNSWLGPIFFSLEDNDTKGLLALLHPDLEGITEVDADPKRGLVFFKVATLPLMIEFSVFIPLQCIAYPFTV